MTHVGYGYVQHVAIDPPHAATPQTHFLASRGSGLKAALKLTPRTDKANLLRFTHMKRREDIIACLGDYLLDHTVRNNQGHHR